MNGIRRRDLIGYLGIAVGAGVVSRGQPLSGSIAGAGGSPDPRGDNNAWVYVPLDPVCVAEKVYEIYGEGGCMYAISGGILACQRETAEVPAPAFPLHMMKYGAGGVGRWGTICGALNGAAAMIGLFVVDKQDRERLINSLFAWYERMKLPRYRPAGADGQTQIVPTTSRSVLCHVSVGTWCDESGLKVDSKEKTERCRRLTVDVAMKTVKLLNAYCRESQAGPEPGPPRQTGTAPRKEALAGDWMGKMRCDTCHQSVENPAHVGNLLGSQRR
jgi:hypothetical protein